MLSVASKKRRIALFLTGVIFFMLASTLYAVLKNNNAIHPFLSITDIHFNPYAACGDAAPCPIIQKLQQADVTEWESILSANDTTPIQYQMETNYPLFKIALAEYKRQAAKKNVEFVVMLGDYLSHNFRENFNHYATETSDAAYQAFVKKTLQFIVHEIAQTFPTTDVYAAVGNNDSYQEDYVSEPNGPFFHDMSKAFASLIKNSSNAKALSEQFPKAGYYAVTIGSANLRLIVLNANLFSIYAKGNNVDAAASDELAWLKQQINDARQAQQNVIIMHHIPNAVDIYNTLKTQPLSIITFYQPAYIEQYLAIIKEYSTTIVAILTGHFHTDGFQLITGGKVSVPSIGTPAESVQFGNNSAYKMFEYNSQSHQIENEQTYFYDVSKQNGWAEEYDFNAIYQPGCTDCNIVEGMKNLQESGPLSEQYIKFFSAGTQSQPIVTKWLPYYWCQVITIKAADYARCLTHSMTRQ